MFTGIIRELGRVTECAKDARGMHIAICAPSAARRVKTGSSVSVDGVCLTVARVHKQNLHFIIMPITLARTTLKNVQKGDEVGIEPSLRCGDEMGGHMVYGHVDGTGRIAGVKHASGAALLTVRVPRALVKYVVEKGAIAVDGVSLTVAKIEGALLTFSLLEQTRNLTSLGRKKAGDMVNIEADMAHKFLVKSR